MTSNNNKKQALKEVRARNFLAKDFDSLRASLLSYVNLYYKDKIKDFSEAGVGGMFVDLAAYVGDVMSFYLDHQFQELDPNTSIESKNIQRQLANAGVKIVGASPAVVECDFKVIVPADPTNRQQPLLAALPIILATTVVTADNGITFELTEDLDYSETTEDGKLIAVQEIAAVDSTTIPTHYYLTRSGVCISGQRALETLYNGSFVSFKRFGLANKDVTEVVSVRDSLGNVYYEVDYLTQDSVFVGIKNYSTDGSEVSENMQLLPCPYRFTKTMDVQTGITTLTFGGGNAETTQEDIIPDPSEFAVPLYGKQTFTRFSLDPSKLLQTNTLGVVAENASIYVSYRYGGGLKHNVSPNSILNVSLLQMSFPGSPPLAMMQEIRAKVEVTNPEAASGGEDAPTINELKTKIPASKNAQNRIVTKEDLLARVYTMPSNFGRVFRAGVRANTNNPLATQLFIVSRDNNGNLTVSPDSLKKNLVTYLNSYRMISDAIDILDVKIVNLTVDFKVTVDLAYNKSVVIQSVIDKLVEYFNIKNFEIDQPIILADITNVIYNSEGILSVESVRVKSKTGNVGERTYSNNFFDVDSNTIKGIVIPPPGGMFEIKYPDDDIIGNSI